jgi:cyclopropane fatty-acyl-phospholipid synthase-like methyltransferase
MKYDYYLHHKQPAIRRNCEKRYIAKLIDTVKSLVPHGSRIFEIGPGNGSLGLLLNRLYVYSGIDISEKNAAHCQEMKIKVKHGDFFGRISFEYDKQPDLIIASQVLEHMGNNAYDFVRKCKSVLAPGGKMLLAFPDPLDMHFMFWGIDYTHNFFTSARTVKRVMEDAGFNSINMKYIYGGYYFPVGNILRTMLKMCAPVFGAVSSLNANWSYLYSAQTLFARNVIATGAV